MLLFFLFVSLLFAREACDFSGMVILSRDDIEECFRTIPLTDTVRSQILDNVAIYAQMSGFYDDLQNPPAPFEDLAIDLVAEVNKLYDNDYTYEYELHHDLISLFKRPKDPHQVYVSPSCFRMFEGMLPWTVTGAIDAGGSTQYVFAPYTDDVKNSYLANGGVDYSEYEGLVVAQINGVDTYDFLVEFGNEHQYVSKFQTTRLNMALKEELAFQSLTYGFPYSDWMNFTLEQGDGTTVVVPLAYFYVESYVTSSNADFETYCPLEDYLQASTALERLAAGPEPSGSPAFRAIWRMQAERKLRDYTLRRLARESGVASEPRRTKASGALGGDLTEIFRTEEGEYSASIYTMNNGTKVGVMWIGSMSPDFGLDLIYPLLKEFRDAGIEKLIIDVRGNGGGYVFLGNQLAWWLNYEIIQPSAGRYRTRLSDTLVTLIDEGLTDPDLMDYISHDTVTYQDLMEKSETMTFLDINGDSYEQEYMPFYTFEAEDYYAENGTLYTLDIDYGRALYELQRNDVLIVTDGYCGSACACFVLHLQQLGGARFVGLGGVWEGDEIVEKPSIASFPGGSVIDSQTIGEYMDELGLEPGYNGLPGQLPRGGYQRIPYHKIFSYQDDDVVLEFMDTAPDMSLAYYTQPAQSSFYADDHATLIPLVVPFFDQFSEGDVARNAAACPTDGVVQTGCPYDAAGALDCGVCEFMYCHSPYYYDYDAAECVQITASNRITEDAGSSSTTWMILAIVFMVLFVLAIAAGFVVYQRRAPAGAKKGLLAPVPDSASDMEISVSA
eukprot:gnl/Chilomastix_cuspidata/1316.p1 GENE.gnl/Chilomastix_cuspidata/1316~~gnl/Chilomastix_cuspidata/1316.p1  ORF type:complete len:782 (+),score=356.64 gnl/Chilomastix_cuspidata/1316:50-2395(+)